MRDLRQWLDEHTQQLEAIAGECDTTLPLVHLAAVLAFQGLNDAALRDQLTAVERRLAADEHRLLVGAQRALPQIRELIASSDVEDTARRRSSTRRRSPTGRPPSGVGRQRQKEHR